MKKQIIALILACVMVTLPACNADNGSGNTRTEKEKDTKEDNKDKKDKSDWSSIDDKDDKGKKSKKDDDIKWSYRSNPVALQDGDDVLASGNYVTVILSDETTKNYPELAQVIDLFNQYSGENMTSYLSGSEEAIRELRSEGSPLGYEEDWIIHPLRSDSNVFSFVMEYYSYMAGAHGTTSYDGFHYDPKKGQEIAFSDAVKDTEGLPQIIIDELIAQNDDLKEYFDELPSDKEHLLEDVTERIGNGAKNLAWGLSYEGLEVFFEDYAMGSYAAGTRHVTIKFKDYPEVFAEEYVYDKKGKKPDIDKLATKLNDADTVMLRIKGPSMPSINESSADQGEPVSLSSGDLQKLNIFISNFAEQGMRFYDDKLNDVSVIANFAYLWSKINKPENIKTEDSYYKVSFDTVNSVANKYLGRTVSDDDFNSFPWKDVDTGFVKNGWYYVPAADGESYTSFAVTDSVTKTDDGSYNVSFTVYDLDIDAYWDNDELIPKRYYSLTSSQAASASELTKNTTGKATVRKNGDSYVLVKYEIEGY